MIAELLPVAEMPYVRIDPIAFEIGSLKVRWYGIAYMLSFLCAGIVLWRLSARGRWPIAKERVSDVLFWGILGVVVGGRLGYVIFYMIEMGEFEWSRIYRIWEGGMSFHGGLIGVALAYIWYARRHKAPLGDLCDGLALATTPGLGIVRVANYINAEHYGTVTDLPWATRFPAYHGRPQDWTKFGSRWLEDLRHPSQLYEALGEGLLLFLVLRYLLIRRKWGAGRIAGAFLVSYAIVRFLLEYVREPDEPLGQVFLGAFTRGQQLSFFMFGAGLVVLWICHKRGLRPNRYDPATGKAVGPLEGAPPA